MLRIDRLATLHLFWPLQAQMSSAPAAVPILMYHSISEAQGKPVHLYYQTTTDSATFAAQMDFLSKRGYTTISLKEAAEWLQLPAREQKKVVVLTFDDGYENFYTRAFPVLAERGFTATVFLPTAYIGNVSRRFNGTSCLTWQQARELSGNRISFGSHTVTHPQLATLTREGIESELRQSKETIEQTLGCGVTSFSYPYAFPEHNHPFVALLRRSLRDTGYSHGVSTIIGTADQKNDLFFMKRLPVNSGDDAAFFEAKLAGAYNWLHVFQYAHKLGLAS